MNTAPIRVPASLLLDPSLPAPAKLIAVALCQGPASPTALQERTGLSRPTIRKALAFQPASAPSEGRMVSIPPHLLADRRLGARAKLLYGLLQLLPGGQTSYAGLAELAQVSLNTVKKAANELAQTGWLQVSQRNQLSPLSFSLTDPGESEVILARQRIEEAPFRGEALMREYLSLLIDSDDFEDDAAPGFLVNPWTDERMQLDRFYPPKVAFEFNGPQHYHATERFSKAEAARQRGRDYMKRHLPHQGDHAGGDPPGGPVAERHASENRPTAPPPRPGRPSAAHRLPGDGQPPVPVIGKTVPLNAYSCLTGSVPRSTLKPNSSLSSRVVEGPAR